MQAGTKKQLLIGKIVVTLDFYLPKNKRLTTFFNLSFLIQCKYYFSLNLQLRVAFSFPFSAVPFDYVYGAAFSEIFLIIFSLSIPNLNIKAKSQPRQGKGHNQFTGQKT